mmetsp:Transcript_26979/g.37537  ORF Transcript_26979/g.37537 Transcript_26979/m.37537 type:complete len:86 (-) Transcript_26979:38-295(-)
MMALSIVIYVHVYRFRHARDRTNGRGHTPGVIAAAQCQQHHNAPLQKITSDVEIERLGQSWLDDCHVAGFWTEHLRKSRVCKSQA